MYIVRIQPEWSTYNVPQSRRRRRNHDLFAISPAYHCLFNATRPIASSDETGPPNPILGSVADEENWRRNQPRSLPLTGPTLTSRRRRFFSFFTLVDCRGQIIIVNRLAYIPGLGLGSTVRVRVGVKARASFMVNVKVRVKSRANPNPNPNANPMLFTLITRVICP